MAIIILLSCWLFGKMINICVCQKMTLTLNDENVTLQLFETSAAAFYCCVMSYTTEKCNLLMTYSENTTYVVSDVQTMPSKGVHNCMTYECVLETPQDKYCFNNFHYLKYVSCQRLSTIMSNNENNKHNVSFLITLSKDNILSAKINNATYFIPRRICTTNTSTNIHSIVYTTVITVSIIAGVIIVFFLVLFNVCLWHLQKAQSVADKDMCPANTVLVNDNKYIQKHIITYSLKDNQRSTVECKYGYAIISSDEINNEYTVISSDATNNEDVVISSDEINNEYTVISSGEINNVDAVISSGEINNEYAVISLDETNNDYARLGQQRRILHNDYDCFRPSIHPVITDTETDPDTQRHKVQYLTGCTSNKHTVISTKEITPSSVYTLAKIV